MKQTQIKVTEEAWECLNRRKKVGDTFSDVIIRMALECPEAKISKFMEDND